jgi:DNA-binding CsgD family transcriptional regulator
MGMVGRAEELRTLGEILPCGPPGTGRVVVIEGAPGTGKTSLLQAFADRAAESGATVLRAAAADPEPPLSVTGRLLRGSAEAERRPRDEASALLRELAERGPLVIAVDDVDHADGPSLRLLGDLARRTRVLLVLTECSRPRPPVHAGLPPARRLRLDPLPEREVATVLAAHLDPQAARRLAPECHRASGGNPLLVQALVEDLRSAGPVRPARLVFGDAFRRAVLTCLCRCEATTLTRLLAVLPDDVCPGLLGALTGLDAEALRRTRDLLRAAGLVGAAGFRHDAVRAAVLGGMRPQERAELYAHVTGPPHGHGDRLLSAGRPRSPADTGAADRDPLAALSNAERRVAALAAGGYTNRQIACRLYVTMSTVEQHLTRVYRKLRISRRTDLPLSLSLPHSPAGHTEPHFSRTP